MQKIPECLSARDPSFSNCFIHNVHLGLFRSANANKMVLNYFFFCFFFFVISAQMAQNLALEFFFFFNARPPHFSWACDASAETESEGKVTLYHSAPNPYDNP